MGEFLEIKKIVKGLLGRCLISAAEFLPSSKRLLRPLGIRTSQDLFGKRTVSIQFPGGQVLRLTSVDETYLAFQLFWRGGAYYEPITRAVASALLRPGDTFLDIGAHVGFFSLACGVFSPIEKTIAFEPNPKNFNMLQANARANGLDHLVCESMAVSDVDGEASLYLTESDMSASLMKDFQAEDTTQIAIIQVRTTALDSYLRRQGIKGPFVIKVDIEGHEPAFFRGAAETIATAKPDIILEVLYEQDPALISSLKSLGYHFYPITDEGFVELEEPKLVKRFPFLFLNHLLSTRPREEIANIFARVRSEIRNLDLLQTSKHFPKEQWPALWRTEATEACEPCGDAAGRVKEKATS
jgi:FkbM family methyltransferase